MGMQVRPHRMSAGGTLDAMTRRMASVAAVLLLATSAVSANFTAGTPSSHKPCNNEVALPHPSPKHYFPCSATYTPTSHESSA